MNETEQATQETEIEDSQVYEEGELEETQLTVYQNLSSNLRTENSGSIKLLDESARLLTESAKSMIQPHKGDFGDDPIRKPTLNDVEAVLKLALGANELMKTKLDYIKEGRNLINNLHEVIEESEE